MTSDFSLNQHGSLLDCAQHCNFLSSSDPVKRKIETTSIDDT